MDMSVYRDQAHAVLPVELQEYAVQENTVPLHFPMLDFPTKVQSTKLDKAPLISGTLTGIKAQYLMLDNYKSDQFEKPQWLSCSNKSLIIT